MGIDDWGHFENHSHLLKEKIYTISISEHIPKEEKFHHQLPNDEQTVAYHLYPSDMKILVFKRHQPENER